jgi:predicted Zn-dependent protease
MVNMKRRWVSLGLPLVLAVVSGCVSAPYTHRSQLMLVSESQEISLGVQAYHEVLKKAKVAHDSQIVEPVRAVGQRLAKAANQPDYKWEFNVIDDAKTANAFALPGGKIAVYTGLFPLAHDNAGLAAVLGHEVGHALAHHSAERLSQGMAFQVLATGVSVALASQSPGTQDAIMQAFGLGTQVGVLLPFSRTQEAEADHIGLILMAQAGYDPHAALELWRRFAKMEKGSPPELLSTHPSYGSREHNIQSWLPEAMRYYHGDPNLKAEPLPAIANLRSKFQVASCKPDSAL